MKPISLHEKLHSGTLFLFLIQVMICFTVFRFAGAQVPGEPEIRLGIMTDIQYCNSPTTGLRHYRLSLLKVDSAAEAMREFGPAHIFHLGDLIDHDFENYDSVLPRMQQFPSKVHLLAGNHDFMVGKEYKQQVYSRIGMNPDGYSIIDGDWQFILLNGSDLSYQAYQTKAKKKERNELVSDLPAGFRCNWMPWNGGISIKQFEWLADELDDADSAGRKVIVMCHFPVFPRSCFNLWNDGRVLELLVQHRCVKAYFNGHYHEGRYTEYEGVHFVNFKGLVDTPVNSFATVILRGDHIVIDGHGREPDRTLKIR